MLGTSGNFAEKIYFQGLVTAQRRHFKMILV